MERLEKRDFVTALQRDLTGVGLVVVTRQTGLTVQESQGLRRKMKEAGAHYKVAKNTLVRFAVQGTDLETLVPHLTGPTAIAYSIDPIAAAKVAVDYANTNDKFEVVCAMLGDKFIDATGVKALAKLPSLDELRGKIVGLLQAPATKVAGVVQAPASQLARLFSAYSQKSS